jgi:hypothetical protein
MLELLRDEQREQQESEREQRHDTDPKRVGHDWRTRSFSQP